MMTCFGRHTLRSACLIGTLYVIMAVCSTAVAAPTGLNTIPTTDIVPLHNCVAQIQNGNSSLSAPAFYQVSSPIFQTQFGLSQRVEAGADWIQPATLDREEAVLNAKYPGLRRE